MKNTLIQHLQLKSVDEFTLLKFLKYGLMITCSLCFIGHGAWGIITKADWIPFYGVFGIPAPLAWKLMPLTGLFDILVGFGLLIRPMRITLLWMAFWTVVTAIIRPMAGLTSWEFVERAGNFGPPIALLYLFNSRSLIENLNDIPINLSSQQLLIAKKWFIFCLSFLLFGHGAFGLLHKKILLSHWEHMGIVDAYSFLSGIGIFEMALALFIFFAPTRRILIFVMLWKIATELLYPITGRLLDIFEFVERWGDYGIPISILFINTILALRKNSPVFCNGFLKKQSAKGNTICIN